MRGDHKQTTENERWLKIKEAAELLGVSRRWIHDQMKLHGLPHVRGGKGRRVVRISEPELMAWWRSHREADPNLDAE